MISIYKSIVNMLNIIGTSTAFDNVNKQQRKNDKSSFLDKKITKACASAICPGAGQFLDGRNKEGYIHCAVGLLCDIGVIYGPRGMVKYFEDFLNKKSSITPLGFATWNFILLACKIGQFVTRFVSACNAYIMSTEK